MQGQCDAAVAAADERAAARAAASTKQLDELNARLWDEEAKVRAAGRTGDCS
eukprot:SAG31_NODE_628_length_13432_cov_131.456086_6_plen_52_part_00